MDARQTPWFAAAFGAHYPLLYRHRDEAEARQCLDLLPHLAPLTNRPEDRVLDLGCGDGRHLQLLRDDGIAVVGLDLSAHLLAVAAARSGHSVHRLVRGDMRCLPFQASSFQSVLSLFTAFGYFGPPAANDGPVREVARVLRPGGHWFLDYFDGDAVRAELGDGNPRTRQRQLDCLLVRETRRYVARTAQVVKQVQLSPVAGQEDAAAAIGVPRQGLQYEEQVAVFTQDQLLDLTGQAGLVLVAGAGDYVGGELGSGSRWIMVFRRKGAAAS